MISFLIILMVTCLYSLAAFECLGQNAKTYATFNSSLMDNNLEAMVVDKHVNKWLGTVKNGLIRHKP